MQDHDRRLNAINGHIERTAKALEDLRLTMGKLLVVTPLIVILSNALVAVLVYELTR